MSSPSPPSAKARRSWSSTVKPSLPQNWKVCICGNAQNAVGSSTKQTRATTVGLQRRALRSILHSSHKRFSPICNRYMKPSNALCRTLRKKFPGVCQPTGKTAISYNQFAASKKHVGLYPGPAVVEAFADSLREYHTSKGTIRLPYDKPLPLALIAEIVLWCAKEFDA